MIKKMIVHGKVETMDAGKFEAAGPFPFERSKSASQRKGDETTVIRLDEKIFKLFTRWANGRIDQTDAREKATYRTAGGRAAGGPAGKNVQPGKRTDQSAKPAHTEKPTPPERPAAPKQSAADLLNAAILEYCSQNNVSYDQALPIVCGARPDLCKAYLKEVSHV